MCYVGGPARYRAGQFEDAAEKLQLSLDDQGWRSRPIVYPALAMAYHRCGRADEAREAFQSSEEAIDHWTKEMLRAPVGKTPLHWFDWIEARLLHREAAILFTAYAPADDPRLREVEQRSLAAIQNGEKP
jgi:hypothetical protein